MSMEPYYFLVKIAHDKLLNEATKAKERIDHQLVIDHANEMVGLLKLISERSQNELNRRRS